LEESEAHLKKKAEIILWILKETTTEEQLDNVISIGETEPQAVRPDLLSRLANAERLKEYLSDDVYARFYRSYVDQE